MQKSYRLFDFNVYNEGTESGGEDEYHTDNKVFIIQMFGINEKGDICSIFVEDFKPFFYVKVGNDWNNSTKEAFLDHVKESMGRYYENSISECKLIKRNKLYGFDGGKEHKFVLLKFNNTMAMNKAKKLWYEDYYTQKEGKKRRLIKKGYCYNYTATRLYEANIPPLLRYFHIKDISPSGWIAIPTKKTRRRVIKTTHCKYEYAISYKHIIPLSNKETPVPYKICSFDIEASSSHGDFPLPIKTYKKLANNIIEIWDKRDLHDDDDRELLYRIINTAFGYDNYDDIETVYPKNQPSSDEVARRFNNWIETKMDDLVKEGTGEMTIESMFENREEDNDMYPAKLKKYTKKKATIVDLLNDKKFDRESKVVELCKALNYIFPKLEGDKVTFIGSTFLRYGDKYPYLNHCIALDTCDDMKEVQNSELESYETEKEVLVAWTKLIQREDPDIIIGYNIFGFDYEFMFRRSLENRCTKEFLKLSRNKGEVCGNTDYKTGNISIENNSIIIASGQYDLHFIKMNGRLQVDLYNYFRRDYNLTSYKLDYVSGYFIGDNVKKLEHSETTKIYSKNLTGLENGNFINFEETSHSTDNYKDGQKFKVFNVNYIEGTFEIGGIEEPDMTKTVRWGLAKDDVTPQDIFRLTNEGPTERAIIAKYCIQDCNLVHHLMRKIDVMTGYIEMAKICSIPMNFLVMRGQGIKLTSYVAKKCREKRTLMPVMEKSFSQESYEGAIVLPPKSNLYLDNPVACVDYSSLYPSSMISENLSHDSKVWTKEYDLNGDLVVETGVQDEHGTYIYDNLPDYEYVDVTYDTYKYIPNQRGKVEKKLSGKKICRFAQFKEGKAIMPSILEELLTYRKSTRTSAKYKDITTKDGLSYTGLIIEDADIVKLKDRSGKIHEVRKEDIEDMQDTYDDFMKNVMDKRQLAAKITANSLYGQCGAKTSTFYEVDVAASCTAIGRNLLTYAKRVIEEVYGDKIVETKNHGTIRTRAEYIYGDTDSVFFTFNAEDLDGNKILGKPALEITIDLAQEAGALATKFLKSPHDLEYEKTFMPFCLLSKKRYVGMLYEHDPDKCKRKSMGIVLKRRDNAPIVKDVYGGIIDILMKDQDVEKAIEFLKECLQNVIDEKYPLEKLIITKSLRSGYKNPKQIAHKVLADRMGKRDPGNKPGPGDRIPFVYVQTKTKVKLQGDKIEHPDYIIKNKLKPDYSFYISNQIMKPVQQVLALVLEDIKAFKKKTFKFKKFQDTLESLRCTIDDDEKYRKKVDVLRNKEVKALIFDKYLRETDNSNLGLQSITAFF